MLSFKINSILLAISSTSSGLTKHAALLTVYGMEDRLEAITAVPHAIASIGGEHHPS
jgi:hypothetical protein